MAARSRSTSRLPAAGRFPTPSWSVERATPASRFAAGASAIQARPSMRSVSMRAARVTVLQRRVARIHDRPLRAVPWRRHRRWRHSSVDRRREQRPRHRSGARDDLGHRGDVRRRSVLRHGPQRVARLNRVGRQARRALDLGHKLAVAVVQIVAEVELPVARRTS